MAGIFINSGILFNIAKQAYQRAKTAVSHDRSHESNEPLISIVFAAAAGEAFINEIGELAAQPPSGFPGFEQEPNQVQTLAKLLSEIEDSRGTTNMKFLIGKLALSGKTFNKGTNPFQDFAILMDLRNSLMHLKFDSIESIKTNAVRVKYPSVVGKLRSQNILAEFEDDENAVASWVLRVSTPAVARWSCNATAKIVKDIIESIPNSELRTKADLFYNRLDSFAPVM
ncbi:MAG TPA: hypothetical protein VGH19_02745 [Verrucomicrobiae bacterium]